MFIAPREVEEAIRTRANKREGDTVEVLDIIRWAMHDTCADIRHHIPHWIQQGVDYEARRKAWDNASSSEDASSALASAWKKPEARSLQAMYWRESDGSSQTRMDPLTELPSEIRRRCEDLGVRVLTDSRLEEEQERELQQEAEREEERERPPKAKPAEHAVHEDVEHFVRTGVIHPDSGAFMSPFLRLREAAGEPLEACNELADSTNLFATADFLTTVESNSETTGDYIRPVHWMVSGGPRDKSQVVVIMSPFEVNELLSTIRESQNVHLHLYTPRTTLFMTSIDHLQLYCIPPLPQGWQGPAEGVIDRLNLCAGQLYLPDYPAYLRLCAFLGVCTPETQGPGGELVVAQNDGFIRPEHRVDGDGCSENPLPYLKALIGFRRKGMTFARTHIGKILNARFLKEELF